MTISQAKHKLQEARILARLIRREIDELRSFIQSKGVDPDVTKDTKTRNQKIYNDWQQGSSFAALSKKYKLHPQTISSICRRLKVLTAKINAGAKTSTTSASEG